MADERQSQLATDIPEWLTLNDAASHFGVSAYTIRRWIREGRLPAEKRPSRYGDQFFVPSSALAYDRSSSTATVTLSTGEHSVTGATHQHTIGSSPDRIVDRDNQLDLLRALLSSAAAGQGQVALVSGDAGIGKTTIVRRCMSDAAELGFQVASGHCYDLEATSPYGPWSDLARSLASAGRTVAELTDTLISPTNLQEQQSLVWSSLSSLARQKPLLLVMEDMHWSDGPSVELLRVIARQVESEPILLLVTHRDLDHAHDHPLSRALPHLVREARATRIALRPFDREAVRQLLADRYHLPEPDQSAALAAPASLR